MSTKLTSAVWDSALPHNEKYIAGIYADSANDDGYNCSDPVAYIAWKTGYSVRSVQSITRSLQRANILEYLGVGPNGHNSYRFHIEHLPQRPQWTGERGAESAPPAKTAPGAEIAPLPGAETAPPAKTAPPADPQKSPHTPQDTSKHNNIFKKNIKDTSEYIPTTPPPAREPAGAAGGDDTVTLEDAFELANILNGVRDQIVKAWATKHNQPISTLDVLAWYCYAQGNKAIGMGAVINRLKNGEKALQKHYAAAAEHLEWLETQKRQAQETTQDEPRTDGEEYAAPLAPSVAYWQTYQAHPTDITLEFAFELLGIDAPFKQRLYTDTWAKATGAPLLAIDLLAWNCCREETTMRPTQLDRKLILGAHATERHYQIAVRQYGRPSIPDLPAVPGSPTAQQRPSMAIPTHLS